MLGGVSVWWIKFEEVKKQLYYKFLEKETYIVAYRSNYDSARQFNNELIDYIKQLQQELTNYKEENKKLKDNYERELIIAIELEKTQKELEDYKERNEKATIKVSELMSKYFYEKDFCIEDTHLDELLQILDKKDEG